MKLVVFVLAAVLFSVATADCGLQMYKAGDECEDADKGEFLVADGSTCYEATTDDGELSFDLHDIDGMVGEAHFYEGEGCSGDSAMIPLPWDDSCTELNFAIDGVDYTSVTGTCRE